MHTDLRAAIERGDTRAARRRIEKLKRAAQNDLRSELRQLALHAARRKAKPPATTLAKLLGDPTLFRYTEDGMEWIELAAAVIGALAVLPPRVRTRRADGHALSQRRNERCLPARSVVVRHVNMRIRSLESRGS